MNFELSLLSVIFPLVICGHKKIKQWSLVLAVLVFAGYSWNVTSANYEVHLHTLYRYFRPQISGVMYACDSV